jgi:hypothetical protein
MFFTFSWPRWVLLSALLMLAMPVCAMPLRAQVGAMPLAAGDAQEQKGKPKKGDGTERPKPKPGPRDGGDDD